MKITRNRPGKRKRPPAKPRYSGGQIVGRFSILKILGRMEFPGGVGRKDTCWVYAVLCCRCGEQAEFGQVRLREQERTGKCFCPVCLEQEKKRPSPSKGRDRLNAAVEAEHIQRANRFLGLWPVPPSVRKAAR